MKTFTFKTNINCGGCIAKVTPFMDAVEGISSWNVDTTNKNKILTVVSDGITESKIIETVKEAGFNIESVSE
ncbi:copper chaperone [Dysgonomonas sp. PFB1-18]|uniref:heavy-metal-associated domain-containing protein n=1 Tax=unclassified Dysgonomonas TaxID=2630389 RepID=UPI0024731B5C|nr:MULTISPECIES: heavy-metal-associated domain-containing protein [unclassified Dysgonomonas]MDH6309296.1 copper chaperone [Dysgonomonas sp. PF1-14]MDH6339839.1 copper chaperone [Dysgonomonas sp. PF1-16]MDH6381487.1 copper chaperone [Dysgonomonas sp. PFB1-18]MDH6398702.1 copper chaperone [Dysgonomonas sp. PF1-23]